MIILAQAVRYEINWNVVIPSAIAFLIALGTVLGFLERVKRWFPSREEFDSLKSEVHELRIHQATVDKLNGKLDQVLLAVDRKRRGND